MDPATNDCHNKIIIMSVHDLLSYVVFSCLLCFQAFLKMQSDPEFAVPGCHYETASGNRRQAVLNFVRDQFWPDEPLSRSITHLCPWTDYVEAMWASVVSLSSSISVSKLILLPFILKRLMLYYEYRHRE